MKNPKKTEKKALPKSYVIPNHCILSEYSIDGFSLNMTNDTGKTVTVLVK